MHSLIDMQMVKSIRATGKAFESLPERTAVLRGHDLPCDQRAENVIISGCIILSRLPRVLASLSRVLRRGGLYHTFLSTEFCCGNCLYRPAIKARDGGALEAARELSREFIGRNLERAAQLGARRVIVFCSPCYPIYKHLFPGEEIVFYPAALAEAMEEVQLEGEVDYYAGCYKLHRRLAPAPMDLTSAEQVLAKLKGLKVNRIDAPQCCFSPKGLEHMVGSVRSGRMVHLCTGCYEQAEANVKHAQVLMLPELVEEALR